MKTFKKSLCLLLALVLCLGMVNFTAFATENGDNSRNVTDVNDGAIGGDTTGSSDAGISPSSEDRDDLDPDPAITTEEALKAAIAVGGGTEVKLGTDITLTATLEISNTVILDLAGHTLTDNGSGSVIKVTGEGTEFTLTDSSENKTGTVTGGVAPYGGGVYVERGTFTMNGGTITGNTASDGGGVYVAENARFNLDGGVISANTSEHAPSPRGFGVWVEKGATFTMTDGEIKQHTTTTAGAHGVAVYAEGTFAMSGGEISGNSGNMSNGNGAVYVFGEDASFEMSGNATITGNHTANAAVNIGGKAVFTMSGNASITGNTCTAAGAVGVYAGSTFTMSGNASINGNTMAAGGGVQISDIANAGGSTFFMKDNAVISGNGTDATFEGGGVELIGNATMEMSGSAKITGNKATGVGVSDVEPYGGGVYIWGGSLTMSGNAEISGNTAQNGGGVYVNDLDLWGMHYDGAFTMSGGSITGNTANGGDIVNAGIGGGVYVGEGASFTMSSGSVSNNTATTNATETNGAWGGGVYNAGSFTMSGGAISSNKAYLGGGVANRGVNGLTSGIFTLSGAGSIADNVSLWDGGGLYNGSVFTMEGGSITGNKTTSGGDGGGIWQCGKNDNVTATMTMTGGTITGNTTSSNGGGVGVEDGTFVRSAGILCNNTAQKSGADVFACEGSMVTLGDISREGWTLNEDSSRITGWFFDGLGCTEAGCTNGRWSVSSDALHIHKLADAESTITSEVALKAAHGEMKTVTYKPDPNSPNPDPDTPNPNNPNPGTKDAEVEKGKTVTVNLVGGTWDETTKAGWDEKDGGSNGPTYRKTLTEDITLTDPVKPGYQFEGWKKEVDGEGNVTFTAVWTPYKLTYNANGGENAPGEQAVTSSNILTVSDTVPTRDGYTFTGWNTAADGSGTSYSGTDPITIFEDTTLYAQWTPNYIPPVVIYYTLTVHYVYADGTTAAPSATRNLTSGTRYTVDSPVIEGYTPDLAVVSGTKLAQTETFTVVYTADQPETTRYTLTVEYVYEDGTEAAATYTETLNDGAAYSVASPAIDGYAADIALVEGTIEGADASYVVTYTEAPEETDIGDDNPPLVDNPDVEDPSEVDIGDENPPLVDNPDEDIPDGDTPLTDVPQTGDFSAVWYAALILSACGLVLLNLKRRRVVEY